MGGSSWFRPSSLGRARSSGSCLEVPPAELRMSFAATLALVAGLRDLVKKAAARTSLAAGRRSNARRFHHMLLWWHPADRDDRRLLDRAFRRRALPPAQRLWSAGKSHGHAGGLFRGDADGHVRYAADTFGLDVIPWKIAGFGLDIVIAIAQMVSTWAAISISADCRVGIFLWR